MKLFFTDSKKYLYNPDTALGVDDLSDVYQNTKKKLTVHFPITIDTEFQSWSDLYKSEFQKTQSGSMTLTTQIKAIYGEAMILDHWDKNASNLPRHFKPQKPDSHHVFVDYLNYLGVNCDLQKVDSKLISGLRKKRVFRLVMYAHYAVADFYRCSNGQLKSDLIDLTIKGKITQKRRLECDGSFTSKGIRVNLDYLPLNYVVTINDLMFALEIAVWDTSALHGFVSLESLAKNTATLMTHKSVYNISQKRDMTNEYIKDPVTFADYALGDLCPYDILVNNKDLVFKIWEALGVSKYFELPKMTVGSTVSKIFNAKIASLFENIYGEDTPKQLKEILETYICSASSLSLISDNETTKGLLAKVLGGRCFNNKGQVSKTEGILVDIDISSCYGEGLRSQTYPIGNPIIIRYPKNAKNNQFLTLRQFLKLYGKDLVDGLYQIWFSVTDDFENTTNPKPLQLVSSQDFFYSYKPPKSFNEIKSDTDTQNENWLDKPDRTKLYSHQIVNSPLTCDGLQWLENICSRPLRAQILDNSIVICAEYYPKKERVTSIESLVKAMEDHTAKNTCEVVTSDVIEVISTDRECKKWYGIELGSLLVDKLILERKKYPKSDPLNSLYKLFTNTTYGFLVSRYFASSNSLVGQNVTARARAMVWYLEKGLNSFQSITDGGVFDLSNVAYGRNNQKINDLNATTINRYSDRELNIKNIEFKPLGGFTKICWGENDNIEFHNADSVTVLDINSARKLIDDIALKHLQNQFKKVDVLHKKTKDIKGEDRDSIFVFESKGIVKKAVFHGSANYYLEGGYHDSYKDDSKVLIAFRSYKKELKTTPDIFANEILKDPSAIERQDPYIKENMIKITDFKKRFKSFYQNRVFIAGESYQSTGLFMEASISQFLFKNQLQFENWEKEQTKLKALYGQSYEIFFTDKDTQKLNYQLMIETLDTAISEGYMSFKDFYDKSRNVNFKTLPSHPKIEKYLELRSSLGSESLKNLDDVDDSDYFDDVEDFDNDMDFTEGVTFEGDVDW